MAIHLASEQKELPGRGLTTQLSQLLPEGSASDKSSSRCWLTSSPQEYQQVLTHTQLLGVTKNKDGSLNNDKSLRANKEVRLGWLTKFISYIKPVCQKLER